MLIGDNGNMVQYGVWTNCCNNCQFCLREDRVPYNKEEKLYWLDAIKNDIKTLDWKDKFSYGISLLGGELYYIKDEDVQKSFLELIDVIIDNVLLVSQNPNCKYSTVTNGLYDPTFLYKVVDKIVERAGIRFVDINFSYDLKYRFKSEEDRLLVLKNIKDFNKRYNYRVCVQMILTQYVINMWKEGKFDVNKFIDEELGGSILSFLYPHPIKTGIVLPDFNFKRADFLKFLQYLRIECYNVYEAFLLSTKNSCSFKYTGLRDRGPEEEYLHQKPRLTDGKELLNPKCGHSSLYQCYSDSDKCVLCDLINVDRDLYL